MHGVGLDIRGETHLIGLGQSCGSWLGMNSRRMKGNRVEPLDQGYTASFRKRLNGLDCEHGKRQAFAGQFCI